MRFKRNYFTLIEMLVVISIIAMIGGMIGININRTLQEQHFRSEVEVVVDQLRLAQDLMLILGENVRVKYISENNRIKTWVELDDDSAYPWIQSLKKHPKQLKYIHLVKFEGVLNEQRDEKDGESIAFLSGGTVMTKGFMRLSASDTGDESAPQRFIYLSGYPQPIASVAVKKANENQPQTDFDEKLARFTFQELEQDSTAEVNQEEEQKTPPNETIQDEGSKKGKKKKGK